MGCRRGSARGSSARPRCVHECRLPAWARALVAEQLADAERLEIRAELGAAGLL